MYLSLSAYCLPMSDGPEPHSRGPKNTGQGQLMHSIYYKPISTPIPLASAFLSVPKYFQKIPGPAERHSLRQDRQIQGPLSSISATAGHKMLLHPLEAVSY